jgi:TPR repeat protein
MSAGTSPSVLRWLAAYAAALGISVSGGCRPAGQQAGVACVADAVGTLQLLATVPECTTDGWLCRARCTAGSSGACLGLAYASQKDSATEKGAADLFRRACVLGSANACTNYAAGLWARHHTDDELACARRTFEKACAAREHFACGMVGRVLLESTTPPRLAEGRQHLEAACNDVGGFACRVLARHLESGQIGDSPPERTRDLLARACAGGDPDACGDPPTASSTFH